jgi:hypothetical protein
MAENRGGMRPTAPQNNPANVSATGGAGQSGKQPTRYISGMPYGQGQQLMEQQKSAPMSAPVTQGGAMGNPMSTGPMKQLRTLLDDTTNPLEPQSTGIDFGRGAGSSAMPQNLVSDSRPLENQAIVKKYLPAFANAAKSKDAPDSFKALVNYLVGKINA